MQIIYTVSDIEWAMNTCLPLLYFLHKETQIPGPKVTCSGSRNS